MKDAHKSELQLHLNKVLQGETFAEKLLSLKEPAEAKAALAELGIELDDAEMKELGAAIRHELNPTQEMADEELSSVLGGVSGPTFAATLPYRRSSDPEIVSAEMRGHDTAGMTTLLMTGSARKTKRPAIWYDTALVEC